MNDKVRLEEAFRTGALVRPSWSAPNLVGLFAAMARLAGVPGTDLDPVARRLLSVIQPEQKVVLIIADGVGMAAFDDLPQGAFLRQHLVLELLSLFPASTTAVMVSLATARWPGQHAAATWWMHLADRNLDVVTLPFTQRDTDIPLGRLGVRPEELFCHPSVWPDARQPFTAIMPTPLVATPFSRYSFGPHPQRAYTNLTEMVSQAEQAVRSSPAPAFFYIYLPQYDEAVHRNGTTSRQAKVVLEQIDGAVGQLASRLSGTARLVVTADHGMMDIPPELWIAPTVADPLVAHLACPPSGEPRLTIFHVKEGRQAVFAQEFRQRFGEHFCLLSVEELEQLELLGPGPLAPETRPRLGDLVAIPLDRAGFLLRNDDSTPIPIIGMHGGLTSREMRVPLVVVG
ncbi:MAG: alkaline phosphatase family protein [Bradymonadales bacterium]|nr:alkaline phosphatase family protein [Bradymonadales bacterium]